MEDTVEVRVEAFDDRSDTDEQGLYAHIYVGANLHFSDGGDTLVLRLYDDEPGVAHLVSPPGWRPDVVGGRLFSHAVAYLRQRRAVVTIQVYDPGDGGFRPLREAISAARRLGLPLPPLDVLRDLEAAT